MIALLLNQAFQGFHNSIGFYVAFDVFHEMGIKYLLADFPAEHETEFLYTHITVLKKFFILIRQQLHCTVADVDQIYQHLDSFAATQHVTAKRPESLLLVVTYLYVPYADI